MTPLPATPPATRRTTLPLEGRYWLVAVASFWLTGWLKGINLILLLAYLLAALFVLNWWIARRSLAGFTARRRIRPAVFAGERSRWEVEVEVGAKPSLGWELIDAGPAHRERWFVANPASGEATRLRRSVTLPKRGVYRCEPLRAATSFPFGLVRGETTFPGRDELIVLPRLGKLHAGRLRRWLSHVARPDERVRSAQRRTTQEVEFHGLRAFRPGDSPRWIHWRTSARRGDLMVREFDQGTHHDLLLIVEPHLGTRGQAAIEAAVSLAATICWAWSRDSGDRVVLAIAGSTATVYPGRDGSGAPTALLAALAGVEGTDCPDLAGVADGARSVAIPAGPALLVTSRPVDARSADELTRGLGRPIAHLDATAPPSFYEAPAV